MNPLLAAVIIVSGAIMLGSILQSLANFLSRFDVDREEGCLPTPTRWIQWGWVNCHRFRHRYILVCLPVYDMLPTSFERDKLRMCQRAIMFYGNWSSKTVHGWTRRWTWVPCE